MATTTTTLLEVANAVLLNLNERALPALTGQLGTQLKNTISSALADLSDASNWNWLEGKINASSWSGAIATLDGNISSVRGVSWFNSSVQGSYIPLTFLPRPEFDMRAPLSFTTNGRPLHWTMYDANRVIVNPYPTASPAREYIWFYVQYYLAIPTSESGVFNMPQNFVNLLINSATAKFALRHHGDGSLAQLFAQEYAANLQAMRSRHQTAPHQAINVYRRRRVSSHGPTTY